MKNARHSKAASSANEHFNFTLGTLPKRTNTVTAGVLAAMIDGRIITGMEAVFKQSTTRAAAFIHRLEAEYGWHIDRRDIATGTEDGRVVWVTAYWLTNDAREAAFEAGAREWLNKVKADVAKRCKQVAAAKAKAARLNSLRTDPRQRDLLEGL
ncbi:conserved protein of unknown function [Ralstonia solanacearum CMR15]|nr:conserved protein of unknown function [Ralstonia solanacearum CMR15]